MTVIEVKKMEQAGTDAVRKLRIEKLKSGHPFMINSNDLPDRQCYLEYPDGSIILVTLPGGSREFVPVRALTAAERSSLRKKFDLVAYA